MGSLAVDDVVTVIFPYSDFSAFKLRPALILAVSDFGNYITCQITSKTVSKRAIPVLGSALVVSGLKTESYIRPDKLFTLEPTLIKKRIGALPTGTTKRVKQALRELFD